MGIIACAGEIEYKKNRILCHLSLTYSSDIKCHGMKGRHIPNADWTPIECGLDTACLAFAWGSYTCRTQTQC